MSSHGDENEVAWWRTSIHPYKHGEYSSYIQKSGKWIEAEQLELQVMDMRRKLLSEEHPHTLTSMENIALTYWNQGKWIEAEQLEVQVMDMRKKLLGAEHPDTLTSMEHMTVTYSNQGKWIEAEQLNVEVIDIRKRTGRAWEIVYFLTHLHIWFYLQLQTPDAGRVM